jgi:hypothetical protein
LEVVAATFAIPGVLKSASLKNWSAKSIARFEISRIELHRNGHPRIVNMYASQRQDQIRAGGAYKISLPIPEAFEKSETRDTAVIGFFVSAVVFGDRSTWQQDPDRLLAEPRQSLGARAININP